MNLTDKVLDARGLNCPVPILKIRKALNEMVAGQTFQVIATDPGLIKDVRSFCGQTGNELVSSSEESNQHIFVIRKSKAS